MSWRLVIPIEAAIAICVPLRRTSNATCSPTSSMPPTSSTMMSSRCGAASLPSATIVFGAVGSSISTLRASSLRSDVAAAASTVRTSRFE